MRRALQASERSEAARGAWRDEVAAVRPEDLVCVDETGSHLGSTPRYAWAPRRQRAYATAPVNRGQDTTVVAALTLAGMGPRLRFDGAMTTARFEGYVRHVLRPLLRPGQVVMADNLRAHHTSDQIAPTIGTHSTRRSRSTGVKGTHWRASIKLSLGNSAAE